MILPWNIGDCDTYCRVGPFNITIRDQTRIERQFRHGRRFCCWAMIMMPSATRRWGGKTPMEEPHMIHRGGFGKPHDWSTCYWYYETRISAMRGMERRFANIVKPWLTNG